MATMDVREGKLTGVWVTAHIATHDDQDSKRGFTLVELMIVVVIIGILAVLAGFGVRKYLANAKTAEATNAIGAINRAAVVAYERELAPAEMLIGQSSQTTVHALCGSATNSVPGALASVKNRKYTPHTAAGLDYHTGNVRNGWTCLKYEMQEPQYYQYTYARSARCNNGVPTAQGTPGNLNWVACAQGDLDGVGVTARFTTGGVLSNGQAVPITQIASENVEE